MYTELLKQIYDGVDEIVIYKNSSLKILYCNKVALKFFGYNNIQDIIGKTDYDLPWAEYADLYSSQEKRSLEGRGSPIMWPVSNADNNLYLSLCQHTVVTGKDKRFILTKNHILKNSRSLELSNLIYSEYNKNEFKDVSAPLTKREGECLFYLLRCKSTKAIGVILGISYRTVETHIMALRAKFNCSYKSELTEKAIAMGFLFYMPESLMDKKLRLPDT